MPKYEFECTKFVNFAEVVPNLSMSDDDDEELLILNIWQHGLMPILTKKSWTVSSLNTSQVQYLHKMPWQ